ncbi:MAG: hypothetical protein AAB421_04105 [Patescibacteria group bacterium]
MAEPSRDDLLGRIYELERENNRMLHGMRRSAFLGGVFKLIMYAAFVGAPIWFYLTYVHASLNSALTTLNQVQGTMTDLKGRGEEIGAQFGGLNTLLEKMKAIPGIGNFGEGQ